MGLSPAPTQQAPLKFTPHPGFFRDTFAPSILCPCADIDTNANADTNVDTCTDTNYIINISTDARVNVDVFKFYNIIRLLVDSVTNTHCIIVLSNGDEDKIKDGDDEDEDDDGDEDGYKGGGRGEDEEDEDDDHNQEEESTTVVVRRNPTCICQPSPYGTHSA
ncbi:hypothetical protein J1N35_038845 [Gossypium stocksii]|uniref:Uncharacterized protein n=1 Tax=Gossypium stocksii TaxID=47602 RepID=A0A9D3ZM59_9ROSI|nr:hypothetical protein J1N35_038845 [Gossypium stocksii]